MEYTIQKLSKLAGVSSRTLRHYDAIGLLKPARLNGSGYRVYGRAEVDRLQQILFYRELGVPLEEISKIVTGPGFDALAALKSHRESLLDKRRQLDCLIANVERTISAKEGRSKMTDQEKFEGFKKQLVEENEAQYGEEAREKYGRDTVEKSNKKVLNMSQEDYDAVTKLEKTFREALAAAFETGDPAGDLAQKAADLHRQWLSYFWEGYTKEAHAGVAQMYVDDPRFTAHYDKEHPGTAAFLRDAIRIYANK